MNKTVLSIAVGVVFFWAFSCVNANVCTISENNLNYYRKPSQELVTISNETNQCKYKPINNYYIRDSYRTRNLNIRSENRRIQVDGKEQESRFWIRVEDTRRVRLTRSASLPDIQRERIRDARKFGMRNSNRRALEQNDRFFENRFNEKSSRRDVKDNRLERREIRDNGYERRETRDNRNERREIRDSRYIRQTTRDDLDARRKIAYTRQNMVAIKDTDTTTSWPFSNFVQSAIGVLGLYYFGMHKSTK